MKYVALGFLTALVFFILVVYFNGLIKKNVPEINLVAISIVAGIIVAKSAEILDEVRSLKKELKKLQSIANS